MAVIRSDLGDDEQLLAKERNAAPFSTRAEIAACQAYSIIRYLPSFYNGYTFDTVFLKARETKM
jgi:hypothetical protein